VTQPSALPVQGLAKGYVYFDSVPAVSNALNVVSVVKNGTGDFTITWTAATFATATYTVVVTPKFTGGGGAVRIAMVSNANFTATTTRILITDLAGALADPNDVMVVAYEL
jgi:voltage-gated potassium channel Kch